MKPTEKVFANSLPNINHLDLARALPSNNQHVPFTRLLEVFYKFSYYLLVSPFKFSFNKNTGFSIYKTRLQYYACILCWVIGDVVVRLAYVFATLTALTNSKMRNAHIYFTFACAVLETASEFAVQLLFFFNSRKLLWILKLLFDRQEYLPKGLLKVSESCSTHVYTK